MFKIKKYMYNYVTSMHNMLHILGRSNEATERERKQLLMNDRNSQNEEYLNDGAVGDLLGLGDEYSENFLNLKSASKYHAGKRN